MFNEVIRIGGGKPLELGLLMLVMVSTGESDLETKHPGEDELYIGITEKAALLSDYPNNCTHWMGQKFG